MIKCRRCGGRAFLDRVYTDNKNFETSCLLCGDRRFIGRETELGQWIQKVEKKRMVAKSLLS